MAQAKRLIVNADDLGRTAGINRGVVEAHRRGIVTSATVMVNYPSAREVAAIARENPDLGLGLHVQLTGGPSSLPPERLRSVVDAEGRLPSKPEGLRDPDPAEVLAEARAQLARFQEILGRLPTHFDSHHHSHRTPAVFEAVLALGKETGRPVRNPSPEMADRLRREGVATTDHFVEEFFADHATLEGLLDILGRLSPGSTELMCHPAVVDDELRASSGYAEPRARELMVLTHEDAKRAVREAGIELVHFGEL
jgi:hypothetical protein